jgi:ABC-type multidrug transport system ATPase subunit
MRVNGNSVSSLVPFREQMAFVPQDDILYEQLTVEDNILFSAILFNKRGYRKPSELLPMVYYAEEVLGIAFIRNSIVGSP